MIKKLLTFILVLIIIGSCNDSHSDALNDSTKIVIERQEKIKNDYSYTFHADGKVYEAKSNKQLKMFKDLFINAERTDYCCCPEENYYVSFYYFENEFFHYYVDTVEFKEKVRIYESSYQYSYLVDKKLWNNYLNEIRIK